MLRQELIDALSRMPRFRDDLGAFGVILGGVCDLFGAFGVISGVCALFGAFGGVML